MADLASGIYRATIINHGIQQTSKGADKPVSIDAFFEFEVDAVCLDREGKDLTGWETFEKPRKAFISYMLALGDETKDKSQAAFQKALVELGFTGRLTQFALPAEDVNSVSLRGQKVVLQRRYNKQKYGNWYFFTANKFPTATRSKVSAGVIRELDNLFGKVEGVSKDKAPFDFPEPAKQSTEEQDVAWEEAVEQQAQEAGA